MSQSMFVRAQGQQESAIDPYDLFSPLLHWRRPALPAAETMAADGGGVFCEEDQC